MRSRRARTGVAIVVYSVDSLAGMELQASRLAARLVELGRRVLMVSTGHVPGPPFRSFERRAGVQIVRIPLPLAWSYETRQALYEAAAALIIRRSRAWIGTIYAIQASTGGIHAAVIAPAVGCPTVAKVVCTGVDGDMHAIRTAPDPEERRRRFLSLDRLACLNERIRQETIEVGFDPERTLVVPNGVDLDRFSPEGARAELPGVEPGAEVVLSLARLHPQKRLHVLIEAFARLAERRPKARLVLAGEGPSRAELEALATRRGLYPGRVVFLGVRKDTPEVLRAAHVFALVSGDEGFPNAILEALACGVPTVVSEIPGNRDIVRHEREGLLVPLEDAASLAAALERLLDDRSLAARLAAAGRARVESELSLDRIVRRYMGLFDALPDRPIEPWALLRLEAERGAFLMGRALGEARRVVHAWLVLGLLRPAVTAVVLRLKRLLGIEGHLVGTPASRRPA